MSNKLAIEYIIDGNTHNVAGRDAWALSELIKAGEKGCTPVNNPAPRWSAYVHNLRKVGLKQ
jgi:hypothetical protein